MYTAREWVLKYSNPLNSTENFDKIVEAKLVAENKQTHRAHSDQDRNDQCRHWIRHLRHCRISFGLSDGNDP